MAEPIEIVGGPDFYTLGVKFIDLANQRPRRVFLRRDGIAFNGRQTTREIEALQPEEEAGYFLGLTDGIENELHALILERESPIGIGGWPMRPN